MTVKQRLMEDLKHAMKRGERARVDCLRMLRARVLEREVELRPQRGMSYELDDEEALRVISAYAKQRRDSIDSYRQGGREDLAGKEEAELAMVEAYLPEPLTEADLRRIVVEVVAECGAASPGDLGRVMKLVMARVRGQADGKRVNRLVREALGGG